MEGGDSETVAALVFSAPRSAPQKLLTTEPNVFVDVVIVVGVNVDFDGDGVLNLVGKASTLSPSN